MVSGLEGITIKRSRKKGKPSLEILSDGKPIEVAKEDLQGTIIDALGLDFRAFKNTVLYGQNDTSHFANPRTKDSDRKEVDLKYPAYAKSARKEPNP